MESIPHGENVVIPIDSNQDSDSAWGGDTESETTSMTSSITKYRFENGRRYHAYKDGEYWGPNDEKQSEQLDINHHIYLLLYDGKLFHAPIGPNPQSSSAHPHFSDFADQFPSASVIGTDLSPTQPSWVPPNCKFEIDDAMADWTFPKDHFDFIHIRGLYGSIRDWPALYDQIMNHLKPGAWFEQVEYSVHWRADDGSIPEGHPFQRWSEVFVESGERMGKTFQIVHYQKQHLINAGFQNIVEVQDKMPVGPWSSDPKMKDIGRWHLLECEQGIEGWAMALLTRVMGWSIEEVQVFLAQIRNGLRDRNVHAYTSCSMVYGQKPFGEVKKPVQVPVGQQPVPAAPAPAPAEATPAQPKATAPETRSS
ncbi:MAG: hypothetical protein M1829_005166 [Trizodia sp. TS-e1964]|nr:MAG: hypothetical protein M1829_005166 [Trizodia sp. TS-e1964]